MDVGPALVDVDALLGVVHQADPHGRGGGERAELLVGLAQRAGPAPRHEQRAVPEPQEREQDQAHDHAEQEGHGRAHPSARRARRLGERRAQDPRPAGQVEAVLALDLVAVDERRHRLRGAPRDRLPGRREEHGAPGRREGAHVLGEEGTRPQLERHPAVERATASAAAHGRDRAHVDGPDHGEVARRPGPALVGAGEHRAILVARPPERRRQPADGRGAPARPRPAVRRLGEHDARVGRAAAEPGDAAGLRQPALQLDRVRERRELVTRDLVRSREQPGCAQQQLIVPAHVRCEPLRQLRRSPVRAARRCRRARNRARRARRARTRRYPRPARTRSPRSDRGAPPAWASRAFPPASGPDRRALSLPGETVQEALILREPSESRLGSGDGDFESGRGSGSPHPVQRSRLAQ